MIIKISQLLDVEKPLADLMQQELPLKLAYRLGKLVKLANEEMREFNRLREQLFKKLGKEDENGNINILEENKGQFHTELLELAEVNIELKDFEPISISDFDGVDIKMSPVQMSLLQDFFKD